MNYLQNWCSPEDFHQYLPKLYLTIEEVSIGFFSEKGNTIYKKVLDQNGKSGWPDIGKSYRKVTQIWDDLYKRYINHIWPKIANIKAES